jgi:hypothetical protein
MAKMTLLEIVQNIMTATEMDDVNSIGDTLESESVALEVKNAYFETIAPKFIPSNKTLIQLDGLSDTDMPNYLKLPASVKEIDWVKYNYRSNSTTDYVTLEYFDPEAFVIRILGQNDASDDVQEVEDFSGVILPIRTDKMPEFWTTFDNEYLVCNAFDEDIEATLQASQTVCWGTEYPQWTHEDDFTPDLDEHLFPLLLAEAKSVVWLNQKNTPNQKEEQRAKRQLRRAQNDLFRMNQKISLPDYGRRR